MTEEHLHDYVAHLKENDPELENIELSEIEINGKQRELG